MRTWFIGIAAGIVVAAVAFFALAPGIVERSMNKVVPVAVRITPEARALADNVADMHADTLLWKRDLLVRSDRGQVDVPRLIAGGYALQVFSSVTKTPKHQNYDANAADSDNITLLTIAQLQPPRTWGSLLQRSLWHAEKLDRAAAGSAGRLRVIRSPDDLDHMLADRARGRRTVGGMLSIEGVAGYRGRSSQSRPAARCRFPDGGLRAFLRQPPRGIDAWRGEARADPARSTRAAADGGDSA